MSGRRIAISALIGAGGCGAALLFFWAVDRRSAIDPGAACLLALGAGALAAGYLDNRLHRRAAALESIAASLFVLVAIAAVNATGMSSPLLESINDGVGWLGRGAAVAAVAALAGAQLGARHAGRPRPRVRAFAAALIYVGTFGALLCGYIFTYWYFDDSPLWPALAFAVLFGAPYWSGLLLVYTFGVRAYRAATAGAFLCGAHVVAVAMIAELGDALHAGELAAIAALVAAAVAVIGRVAHAGIDVVVGRGWEPPGDDADLPRAQVRSRRDPGETP